MHQTISPANYPNATVKHCKTFLKVPRIMPHALVIAKWGVQIAFFFPSLSEFSNCSIFNARWSPIVWKKSFFNNCRSVCMSRKANIMACWEKLHSDVKFSYGYVVEATIVHLVNVLFFSEPFFIYFNRCVQKLIRLIWYNCFVPFSSEAWRVYTWTIIWSFLQLIIVKC